MRRSRALRAQEREKEDTYYRLREFQRIKQEQEEEALYAYKRLLRKQTRMVRAARHLDGATANPWVLAPSAQLVAPLPLLWRDSAPGIQSQHLVPHFVPSPSTTRLPHSWTSPRTGQLSAEKIRELFPLVYASGEESKDAVEDTQTGSEVRPESSESHTQRHNKIAQLEKMEKEFLLKARCVCANVRNVQPKHIRPYVLEFFIKYVGMLYKPCPCKRCTIACGKV